MLNTVGNSKGIHMNKRLTCAIFCLCFSFNALASDPTPLIKLFFEWPLLILSTLFCFMAYKGLRHVLIANLLLGAFELLVLWWLTEADYMNRNGELLLTALVINAIGIALSVKKVFLKR